MSLRAWASGAGPGSCASVVRVVCLSFWRFYLQQVSCWPQNFENLNFSTTTDSDRLAKMRPLVSCWGKPPEGRIGSGVGAQGSGAGLALHLPSSSQPGTACASVSCAGGRAGWSSPLVFGIRTLLLLLEKIQRWGFVGSTPCKE